MRRYAAWLGWTYGGSGCWWCRDGQTDAWSLAGGGGRTFRHRIQWFVTQSPQPLLSVLFVHRSLLNYASNWSDDCEKPFALLTEVRLMDVLTNVKNIRDNCQKPFLQLSETFFTNVRTFLDWASCSIYLGFLQHGRKAHAAFILGLLQHSYRLLAGIR